MKTQSSIPDESPTNDRRGGVRSSIRWFKKNRTILTNVITFIATTVTYLVLLNGYLQQGIEKTVTKRLGPFEDISFGLSLNQADDCDGAIVAFRHALENSDSVKMSSQTKELLFDGLLYAIVNSDAPEKSQPEFEKIKARIPSVVRENGWRMNQIGFYYLQTGDTTAAKAAWERSYQLFQLDGDFVQSSDALRGLCYCSLFRGDAKNAFKLIKEASLRNPKTDDLELLYKELPNWQKVKWYRRLFALYDKDNKLSEAVRQFKSMLKKALIENKKSNL